MRLICTIGGCYRNDKLTVRILSEESHEVTVAQAQEWLERRGVPAEMALMHELKRLFHPVSEGVRRAKRS